MLDELLVTFSNEAELQAFVERWNGEVLERDVDEDEGVIDALVRVDPSTADLDQFAVAEHRQPNRLEAVPQG